MPRILAHRGDSQFFPENTMPAFLSARDLKVDVIETDVHLTKDGELVIWHDDTLDRQTDACGPVESFTLAQLQGVDAGFRFTSDGGKTFPFRSAGIGLVPLAEALEALPQMRFNIDLKTGSLQIADAFAAVIRSCGAQERVLGASFHGPVLRRLRKLLPQMASSYAVDEVRPLLLLHKIGLPPPARRLCGSVLQVPPYYGRLKVLSPRFIRQFHRAGQFIHVWTINDRDQMHRFIEMGVDGIFTDNPRLLAEVYAERGSGLTG